MSDSDGFGSSVEGEPLSLVPWGMVLDLELVLTVSGVGLAHIEGSSSELSSELEKTSIPDWWVFVLNNNLEVGAFDDLPSLVGTVVAVPPDHVAVVVVMTSMDVKALTSIIPDVSSASSIDSESLEDFSSPLSDNSCSSDVESLSLLVREGKVSSGVRSDGSGSSIEDKPSNLSKLITTSVLLDVEVADSQSVLLSTDVLGLEQVLSCVQGRSDVECDSILQWLSISWLVGDGVDAPALVGSVMAVVPDDILVMKVLSLVNIKTLVSKISDVLSVTTVEFDLLSLLTTEASDDSLFVDSVALTTLVR